MLPSRNTSASQLSCVNIAHFQFALPRLFSNNVLLQDTFDIRICLARSFKHTVNFQAAHESDLYNIDIPVSYVVLQSGTVHGLAFWFDVAFLGSQ